jgi:hypothetical protein
MAAISQLNRRFVDLLTDLRGTGHGEAAEAISQGLAKRADTVQAELFAVATSPAHPYQLRATAYDLLVVIDNGTWPTHV